MRNDFCEAWMALEVFFGMLAEFAAGVVLLVLTGEWDIKE